jgi:hypothetical protein
MQIPGNELLTSIGVGKRQLVVGIAYKISATTTTVILRLSLIVNVLHQLAQSVLTLQMFFGMGASKGI